MASTQNPSQSSGIIGGILPLGTESPPVMYERILVPTDGSEGAETAVKHAIEIANRFDAEILTVYAVDPSAVPPDVAGTGMIESLEREGERAVESIIEQVETAGVAARGEVVDGPPSSAILGYIEDNDVDLVVMGTHGRTGLDRVLLGSVTERLVRTSTVPILTVRLDGSG